MTDKQIKSTLKDCLKIIIFGLMVAALSAILYELSKPVAIFMIFAWFSALAAAIDILSRKVEELQNKKT